MAKRIIVKIIDIEIIPAVVGSDPEVPGSGTNATVDYVLDKILTDGCAAQGFSVENKKGIHKRGGLDAIVYEVTQ